MEMGEIPFGGSRSWEEEMYWTNFRCLQFSQILRPGFDHCLPIPEQFTKNLGKKLPNVVTLKGPSRRTWEVGLMITDDIVFFTHGWETFVNDHSLVEKDLLIFKYTRDSCFEVLMFDGQSLCEKAASYFVRKCERREQESGCQTKRKIVDISVEDTLPSLEIPVEGCTPEKSVDYEPPITSRTSIKNRRKEVEWFNAIHEEPSTSVEEVETKPDIEPISPSVVHDVPYISSRRLISEEEKQAALQLAQAALTSEGFMVVMKPTHVYRRYYMSVPSFWMVKHLGSMEKQDVILRMKENTWNTKFYYQKSRHSGGLSSGWKNFARANDLQEFDVCVFEPGGRVNDVLVLDVNIFRVFQDDL